MFSSLLGSCSRILTSWDAAFQYPDSAFKVAHCVLAAADTDHPPRYTVAWASIRVVPVVCNVGTQPTASNRAIVGLSLCMYGVSISLAPSIDIDS